VAPPADAGNIANLAVVSRLHARIAAPHLMSSATPLGVFSKPLPPRAVITPAAPRHIEPPMPGSGL